MRTTPKMLILVAFSVTLSGCGFSPLSPGVGLGVTTEIEEWRTLEIQSVGRSGEPIVMFSPGYLVLEDGKGDALGTGFAGEYCTNPSIEDPKPWLRVNLWDNSPPNGKMVGVGNWTNLQCNHTYELIVGGGDVMRLYHCKPCRTSECYPCTRDSGPLPSSPA